MDFRSSRQPAPEVSLVPLVDVVFLLLLFFILTTTFRELDFFSVQLAGEAAQEEPGPAACAHLALDAAGEVYLEGRPLPADPQQRMARLRAVFAEAPEVCVHAHALTPHGAVVDLMTRARALGAGSVRLGALGEHLP